MQYYSCEEPAKRIRESTIGIEESIDDTSELIALGKTLDEHLKSMSMSIARIQLLLSRIRIHRVLQPTDQSNTPSPTLSTEANSRPSGKNTASTAW